MKVFVGVLALAGLAAAGVVLDSDKVVEQPLAHSSVVRTDMPTGVHTDVHPNEQSGVHSGVHSQTGAQPVLQSAVKPEHPIIPLSHTTFGIFGAPHFHHGRHEIGMMKKILEGPVMVAFYDVSPAIGGKMQAFLLPNGFADMTGYDREEIFPLIRYLTNGRRKSFLYPSAINYLRTPEMFLPLRELHLPSYNLNTAFRISQDYSSLPYVLISDDEYLLTHNLKEKLDHLKEMGVFGLEGAGLKVVRDNYPREHLDELFAVVAHPDPVRSVEYLVAVPTPVSAYAEEPRIHHDKWFGLF